MAAFLLHLVQIKKILYNNIKETGMRLTQKSFLHTGYFILDNGEVHPAFTDDLVEEAMRHPLSKRIKKIYGVIGTTFTELQPLAQEIKEFKEKYGIIPQDKTEQLRTGFSNSAGLAQSLPRYCYK